MEDTPVTLNDIRERFGPEVADLVDRLTKTKKTPCRYWAGIQASVAAQEIKLADRCSNLSGVYAKGYHAAEVYAADTRKHFSGWGPSVLVGELHLREAVLEEWLQSRRAAVPRNLHKE